MSELISGDYNFILDAVNLFNKFFEYTETGSIVSTKLRNFFQNVMKVSNGNKKVVKKLGNVKKDKKRILV